MYQPLLFLISFITCISALEQESYAPSLSMLSMYILWQDTRVDVHSLTGNKQAGTATPPPGQSTWDFNTDVLIGRVFSGSPRLTRD